MTLTNHMDIPTIIKILQNLFDRDADCQCGGVQLTAAEMLAIKTVIDSLKGTK